MILPGPLAAATIEWFRRLPASTETREDTYLLAPWLEGLSVKIRADTELNVKAYLGSSGISRFQDALVVAWTPG